MADDAEPSPQPVAPRWGASRSSETVDLLVVGAGIVGTWVAYLAQQAHPSWKVVLADRSLVGGGATRFSLGFSLPLGRDERQRQMAAQGPPAYRQLARDVDGVILHPLAVRYVVARHRLPALTSSLAGVTPSGHDCRAPLLAAIPELSIGEDEIVVDGGTGFVADAAHIATSMARHIRAGSAVVWEGVAVEEVRSGDGVWARFADGRQVPVQRAVVATGPMLVGGLLEDAAARHGIRVKKIVSLHFDRCPRPDDPVVFFADDDAFLLPLVDRRQWVLSYTSLVWDCAPDPGVMTVNETDRVNGLAFLARRWTSLLESYGGGRASCDAYSHSWTPVVEPVDEAGRIVIAGGCSGSGFRLAPAIAAEALALVSQARGSARRQ